MSRFFRRGISGRGRIQPQLCSWRLNDVPPADRAEFMLRFCKDVLEDVDADVAEAERANTVKIAYFAVNGIVRSLFSETP